MRLHQRLVSIFGGIRKEVATHLDEQAINAACRGAKYTWRSRNGDAARAETGTQLESITSCVPVSTSLAFLSSPAI